jgi:hypothetical protein
VLAELLRVVTRVVSLTRPRRKDPPLAAYPTPAPLTTIALAAMAAPMANGRRDVLFIGVLLVRR